MPNNWCRRKIKETTRSSNLLVLGSEKAFLKRSREDVNHFKRGSLSVDKQGSYAEVSEAWQLGENGPFLRLGGGGGDLTECRRTSQRVI